MNLVEVDDVNTVQFPLDPRFRSRHFFVASHHGQPAWLLARRASAGNVQQLQDAIQFRHLACASTLLLLLTSSPHRHGGRRYCRQGQTPKTTAVPRPEVDHREFA